MNDLAIDIRNTTKTYKGKVRALRGVDLSIGRGEVFGLLGPNGAGKSTLVKILMTVVRPGTCEGHLLGQRIGTKAALARVGYLPEHHRFPGYLTGTQVLDFYGAMGNVPRRTRRRKIGELLDLVGMSRWADTPVRKYSKGMRQRVGVAQALVNDPELVLLDEPTDGVDPVGRRDIRVVLQRLKDQGRTVFLNSHLLSELEMVCERVAILVQGVVAQQGTIDELTRDQQRYEISVAPGDEGKVDKARLPGDAPCEIAGSTLRIGTTDAPKIQGVIDALRGAGVVITRVAPVRPSLEDLFMQAVTDPATGEVLEPGAEEGAPRGNRRRRKEQERRR